MQKVLVGLGAWVLTEALYILKHFLLFFYEVFFMESICEDQDIVAANIKVCLVIVYDLAILLAHPSTTV